MNIAIIAPYKDVSDWVATFLQLDSTLTVEVFPDIHQNDKIEAVVLWQHPHGILKEFPNLRLICSMGSGVDHIMADPDLPKDIPITRIVDPRLTFSMTNYVVMGVLNFHRQLFRYLDYKKRKIWDMSNPEIDIQVGVMGAGQLGGDVLDKLKGLGIIALAYGNSPKESYPHPYFYGDQLDEFLQQVNVVVCMLPLTPKTVGFLNLTLFEKFQKGTYLINVARGKHLIEEDLIDAISAGYISGALLDVFQEEPMPPEHPFWEHPSIMMTPHIACITMYQAAVPQILSNIRNLLNETSLQNQIDPTQGY
ncbi:2-hydroxyacid dehydrogenase [Lunatibacter salilacus]|uniref:2-hydroxyacid dehydrogenase n=1 Tax=Lunatibacter salilacus TaxID=2483804 RepID=UPI00131C0EEA|nr:glyoxylate/hydroxypyruvate reductase A [Lunatibacter salilacus]